MRTIRAGVRPTFRLLPGAMVVSASMFLLSASAFGQTPPDPDASASPAEAESPPPPAAASRAAEEGAEGGDDTPADLEQGGEFRVVGGHKFITPTTLPSAMTVTSLAFFQGFGFMSFDGTNAVSGEAQSASAFLYGQSLNVQLGFSNRVAVELTASGAAAVGGDLDTLLTLGAIANLRAGGGPKVRIITLDSVGLQLTAGASILYVRSLQVSPGLALNEVAETGDVEALGVESLLFQSEQGTLAPALMVAEGIGPFGVQLAVQPEIGFASDDASSSLTAGGQLELDISNIARAVPVALAAEYVASLPLGDGDLGHYLTGGVYYSGRRDFLFGGAATFSPSESITIVNGQLGMQYFF